MGCSLGIARERGQSRLWRQRWGGMGSRGRPESSLGLEETLGDPSCWVLAVSPRWPCPPKAPVLPPSTSVRAGKLRHGDNVVCLFSVSAERVRRAPGSHSGPFFSSHSYLQSLGWCQEHAAFQGVPPSPLTRHPSSVPVAPSQQMPNLLSRRKKRKRGKKKATTQPNNMRKKCWCVLGGLVETPRWIPPKGGARAGSRPPAGPAAFFLNSLTIWGLNFSLKNMYF